MSKQVRLVSSSTHANRIAPHSCLNTALLHSAPHPALELAAGFGRWWFDPDTSQMVISAVAAQYLSVEPGHHSGLDSCFIAVVLDDLLPLISHLTTPQFNTASVDFRVISPVDGLHWLRMTGLPADPSHPSMVSGILVDVTPAVHATMRERLGFELTEF